MTDPATTGSALVAESPDTALRAFARPKLALTRTWVRDLRVGRLGSLSEDPPKPLKVRASYHRTKLPSNPPSLSIVTPTLNHAQFITHTMESVLSQRYPRLEYVVQDGGSQDGTPEILEGYSGQLARWDSSADRGQAHAINKGFAGTSGEIMAYLNSDDLILPGALAYVCHYFAENPDVDVVYGHRVLIDVKGSDVGRQVFPPHDDAVLAWADYVPQETMYWRRNIWDRIGGSVDETFQFAMDWDLLLRFVEAGARIRRLPRFLGGFRIYEQQKTQSWQSLGETEMFRLRARVHGREVDYPEIHQNIEEYLRRHRQYQRLYRLGLLRH